MKWSQLPQKYKDLAKNFSKDANYTSSDSLKLKFLWSATNVCKTPELSCYFWEKCHLAKDISELPKIPLK